MSQYSFGSLRFSICLSILAWIITALPVNNWIPFILAIPALFIVFMWGSGERIKQLLSDMHRECGVGNGTFITIFFLLGVLFSVSSVSYLASEPILKHFKVIESGGLLLTFFLTVLFPVALVTYLIQLIPKIRHRLWARRMGRWVRGGRFPK